MDLANRPRYHFQPLANWMNDPNGLIQWQGRYHLFYQHNPNGAHWGQMHWGHAASDDLVHWVHLPIALAPTPGGPDKDGCFTGCAVDDDGVPTLVYTGVKPEVQCIATSDDRLITWTKHPGNPAISSSPNGLAVTGFRDPYVWREDDGWYAAIGSGLEDIGGAVLLYRSPDLLSWDYVGPLCTGRSERTGRNWECPNFFPLAQRHVLIISPQPFGRAIYMTGRYDNHIFEPDVTGEIDLGGCFYAPQVMIDERGRRLMWGWLWEKRSREAQKAAGWAGVMSLPRELLLNADGTLGLRPVEELGMLRGAHWGPQEQVLTEGLSVSPSLRGACLELSAVIDMDDAQQVALELRCSPDGQERTTVRYDAQKAQLCIDTRAASSDEETQGELHCVALDLAGQRLRLRVFVDRSVVEVFANERVCLTSRIYPTRTDSSGVSLTAARGRARLVSFDVWEMASIW